MPVPLLFASPTAKLSWREEASLEFGLNHPEKRIVLVSFSPDSKYLAVGFTRLIQVWDLQQLGLQRASPRFAIRPNHEVTSCAWIKSDYLVHGHLNGRVGVSAVEGLALDMKVFRAGPSGDISSFTFLGEGGILAVGVGDAVYLWRTGNLQFEWKALGSLPAPPVIDHLSLQDLKVTSIFALGKSTLLVSYGESAVVTWDVQSLDPVQATATGGYRITGRITDLCSKTQRFLVTDTDRGLYMLHNVNSPIVARIYRPTSDSLLQRGPLVREARFLSEDVVAGSDSSKVVLWDSEGKQLQTVGSDELDFIVSFTSRYDEKTDVGYMAIAVNNGNESSVRLWRTFAVDEDGVPADRDALGTRILNTMILICSVTLAVLAVIAGLGDLNGKLNTTFYHSPSASL
ncbi:hypothetical protein V5O48_008651 [Marasmius crinis-equi]|uniref:WD40 repeat-like protein n=1 Tax=Marasmius crinis-equi TaxID=585013 RepID=A0ABR3FDB1_9AGAR